MRAEEENWIVEGQPCRGERHETNYMMEKGEGNEMEKEKSKSERNKEQAKGRQRRMRKEAGAITKGGKERGRGG